MSSQRLLGKKILITAAAQGIGRATALACAQAGAQVIATDINLLLLEELRSHSPNITIALLNVIDTQRISELATQYQDINVLFNCAGVVHNGTIEQCTETEWDFGFDLNVKSMYRMIKAFMPVLLTQAERHGSASIINMASMASSIKGFSNRFVYGATKAAVIGMTKAIAIDYVQQGLRCNAICPGTVDTPSLRGRITGADDPIAAEKNFLARQPMGRFATPEEIAPLVVFLASDESAMVTGQALLIDGGVTI